jgi:predicted Zn-dependent protease
MIRVASRILSSNSDLKEIGSRKWTVTVIDRGDKNAFVLPTGNIFVFSGMLDLCMNDDMVLFNICTFVENGCGKMCVSKQFEF